MIKRSARSLSFILILSLIFTFAACGAESEPETEYDFSAYFGDHEEKDYINEMLAVYASETGIKIEPVFNSFYDEDTAVRVTDGAYEGYYPVGSLGYGLAADSRFITDLVGSDHAEALIADLKSCEYEDWSRFLIALDEYIKSDSGTQSTAVINGNQYTFLTPKSPLTTSANGIFAFAGGDREYYGDRLMNVALQNTTLSAVKKAETTREAIGLLTPAVTAYVQSIDVMTARIAGKFAPGIRGNDFISRYYNLSNIEEIFAEDCAVFAMVDNEAYERLHEMNAAKAESLIFIPIKMPGLDNSSIPAKTEYSIGLTEGIDNDEAAAFVEWYATVYVPDKNPLTGSIMEYIATENTFRYEINDENFEDWEDIIFGDQALEAYLAMPYWGDFMQNVIIGYLCESWANV